MTKQLTIPKKIKLISIKDEKTLSQATEILSQANLYLDSITKEKEKLTKPLNQTLKEIRLRYKPVEEKLEDIIQKIRSMMIIYQTALEKEKLITQQEITSKLTAGKLTLEKAVDKMSKIETPSSITTESGSIKFKEIQTLKIIDITKIPHEYFDLNESRLLKDLRIGKAIKGAEIEVIQVPVNYRVNYR